MKIIKIHLLFSLISQKLIIIILKKIFMVNMNPEKYSTLSLLPIASEITRGLSRFLRNYNFIFQCPNKEKVINIIYNLNMHLYL